jgi:endonuclease/exonuclease/phosphatase family metal-dependent hydrolase
MITRLASYNIQYGKGKDDRFDLDRILSELAAPI